MTLLIGDPAKPNTDTLIWALPISVEVWTRWQDLALKFKTKAQGVVYLNRMEGPGKRTIILLPTEWCTDEQCEMAAAHIRVVKQFEQRIYVVRHGAASSGARLLAAGMTDTRHVEEVEESEFKREKDFGPTDEVNHYGRK